MKPPLFHGVCTALVTPFEEDHIDYRAYDLLLDRQLRAQVDALLVCGTTGEAPTLSDTEKLALFDHTVQYIHGRCPVLAGTGCNCTAHTVELSVAAEATGVDGLLVVTPYYNKCTQAGLVAHYEAIAAKTELPILLYHVPSRTGVEMKLPTCKALSANPHICGIKEASTEVVRVSAIRHACPERFAVWCGNDSCITPFYAAGACGVVSVLSNLCPQLVKELTNACETGDYMTAAALQSKLSALIEALFLQPNPIPIKAALKLSGMDVGGCRLPLTDMEPEPLLRLKAELQELQLLPS